jgi:CRISPR-associated endonuclease/helicase Cas3
MKKVYDRPDIPPNLLAKSPRYDENGCLKEGCLLVRHTLDVVAAARDLIKVLGSDLQKFFKLSEDQMPRLITTSKLAAFFHDIGKANDGFVAMLEKRGVQSIRHEHLSALLMSHQPLREWLLQKDKDVQDSTIWQTDYEIARLVVAGYHLKTAIRLNTNPRFVGFAQRMPGASSDKIIVYSTHGQFLEWLDLLSKEFGLSPRTFEIPPTWSFSSTARTAERVHKHAKRIVGEFGHYCAQLRRKVEEDDWSTMRLWMAVKCVLIAADAAASAIRRKGLPLENWIEQSLDVCASVDDLEELKKKYVATVEARQRKKKGQENFTFCERGVQEETPRLGSRAALVSSCGSGKTYAGYLWAQKQIEKCDNRGLRTMLPTIQRRH